MAMPSYDDIRKNYLAGKWNDRMLKTAVTCKAITMDQYNAILKAKAKASKA